MKKIFSFSAVFMLLTTIVFSQNLIINYQFKSPQVITRSDGYSEIVFDNCFPFGDEGFPLIPLYGADLLLPQGHEISGVEILEKVYSNDIDNINIKPAARQFPVSVGAPEGYNPVPDPSVYLSDNAYPLQIIDHISTGYLAGHSIGSFSVCPVVYYPLSNRIKYITSITIEVQTRASVATGISNMLKNSQVINERISRIVDNPDEIKNYIYTNSKDGDDVDILLITKNSLVSAFNDYVSFKSSTGYITEVISTETIFSQYSGIDNQDKIRNCIIDYYMNHNLEYVILGGDADPNSSTDRIIPHRGFFAVNDNDIPSDMYYCCLDGNWNNDGDDKWGEPGEYDLYAEVGIGRICIDNATEVTNFTNKLKLYQNSPVIADIKKTLMVGEELNNNPPTYGDTYKEEIVNGSSGSGFTTAGIPSSFQVMRLYDTQGGWSKYDVYQKFNTAGVNLLNHLGHSYVNYNMRMDNGDLTTTNFTNNGITRGFVIGYSQGCYNGSFDNRDDGGGYGSVDCFAEKFTTIATGEVACIANSRYGWYAPGATNSSSQFHDRQFFDAIFGEGISQIGWVNADAKEDNAAFFTNDSYMRWVVYETNLFGDPSMDIWTEIPVDITVNYPPSIPIGSGGLAIQTNTPNARIGITQNGTLIGRAMTNANGASTLQFFSPVVTAEPISVSVIAHNKNRHIGTIQVLTDQPFVLFESYQVNDPTGNGNGNVDFGETIQLGLTVKNVGNQPANNVTVNLTTDCPFVSFTDASQNFGNFSPGQSVFVNNAFGFVVAQNIPDNEVITIYVEAVGSDSWNSSFTINAHAPKLNSGGYVISDPSGNNNGRLDPGETVNITFQVMNEGQSDALNTIAKLLTSSPYITISDPIVSLGILEVGESNQVSFTVTSDPNAPTGVLALFSLQVSSGFYYSEKISSLKIGMIVEDWETGNFNQFNWTTSGHAAWTVTPTNPYQGNFCAKSGSISNSQYSILMLSYSATMTDSISFYVKVSSEANNDFLKFYIDAQVVAQWSGETSWIRVSYPLAPGTHNFKWHYVKNANTSSGSDCAWIDFIGLPSPPLTAISAGMDDAVCAGSVFNCSGSATNVNSFIWTTSGTGTFNIPSSLNPVYVPGTADIDAGSVILTLTANSGTGTLTDDMLLTIHPLPEVDLGPDVSVYAFEPVLLDAGNPGLLFKWSTGEITQTITATSGGIVGDKIYSVEVTGLNGCSVSDEIIISFLEITGLVEKELGKSLQIFPNPGSGIFNVKLNGEINSIIEITIYNAMNEVVYQCSEHRMQASFEKEINLNYVAKGLYILQITGTGFAEVRKFIVQ